MQRSELRCQMSVKQLPEACSPPSDLCILPLPSALCPPPSALCPLSSVL